MAQYEYDSYRFSGERPVLRIGHKAVRGRPAYWGDALPNVLASETTRVVEYHLDWGWHEPQTIALDDGLRVRVLPYGDPSKAKWGLVAWGACSAHIERWGATLPVDMMDERVVAGLKQREEMEALAWLTRSE